MQAAGLVDTRMEESTRVQTKAVEMGEFFCYDIETPVTVKRGQSAMVPIIQTKLECKKEHVYNSRKMPRNPVVTMRIKNDTGMVLERGPVVVLDDGTYVGEGIVPYTTVGTENNIAYSVDLGVTVSEEWKSEQILNAVGVAGRYFKKEYREERTLRYAIENKKGDAIDLVVEHPKNTLYELFDTPKPTEDTESFYRWKMAMKPKTKLEFPVKEKRTYYSHEEILATSKELIEKYLKDGKLPKVSYERIAEIGALQAKVVELQQRIANLQNEQRVVYEEQGRIRSNLSSLGNTSQEQQLRSRYVQTLDKQEGRLAEIRDTIAELNKENGKLQQTIDDKLNALT